MPKRRSDSLLLSDAEASHILRSVRRDSLLFPSMSSNSQTSSQRPSLLPPPQASSSLAASSLSAASETDLESESFPEPGTPPPATGDAIEQLEPTLEISPGSPEPFAADGTQQLLHDDFDDWLTFEELQDPWLLLDDQEHQDSLEPPSRRRRMDL